LTKISESQSAKNVSHEKSPIKLELPSFVMHADNKDRAFVNIRNILDYTETEIRALSHSPRLKLPDEFLNKIKRGKPVFQPESKEDPSIPNIKEKESVQEMDEGYSSSTSSNLGEVEKTNETSIMTAVDKCTDAPTIVVIDDEDENPSANELKHKFMSEDVHFKELIDDIISLRTKMSVTTFSSTNTPQLKTNENDIIEID
jgi:hypothetical protein